MNLLCRIPPRRYWFAVCLGWALCCCGWGVAGAQPGEPVPGESLPGPPGGLEGVDHAGDNGTAIDLRWSLSIDDRAEFKPRRV
ncbi:MAG: hypothetical protein ACK5EA_18160, partial [Planctomycetaceae bacterium]